MKNKIESLQIIRCFAAVLVAICHIWNDGWLPQAFVDLGNFGVDLFFVLSGFIMCLTVKLAKEQKLENASYFFRKRVVRIFPIYIICAVPLLLFNIKAEGFEDLYFYIGNLLLLPSFRNDPNYALVLGPGWSLVYEMLFYSVFAFFLLVTKNKNKLLLLNGSFLLLIVLLVRSFNIQGPQLGWVNLTYIIGDTLMWNFVLGIVTYYIFNKLKNRVKLRMEIGLLALIVMTFVAAILNSHFGFSRFVAFGISAFIIVSLLTLTKNNVGDSKILKSMVFVGDASYSIYLIHYYFAFFKPKVLLMNDFFNIDFNLFLNLIDILLVVGSVIAGCVFYRVVEQPIIKYFSRRNFKKQISPIIE